MNAKKLPAAPEVPDVAVKQIPHAYALVADPEHPGLFFACYLKGVHAEDIVHLEPSSRSSYASAQLVRIYAAMDKRHQRKEWDK